jgi:hypothetical protein
MRRSTLAEWSVVLFVLAVVVAAAFHLSGGSIPPDLLAPPGPAGTVAASSECSSLGTGGFYQEPLPVPPPPPVIRDNGVWTYTLTPRYRYTMVGRIVGKDAYSLAGGNEISPMDITMANGDLITPEYRDRVRFQKIHRAYLYTYQNQGSGPQLTRAYVIAHSSNSHLLFSDDAVWRRAEQARVGDFVRISGYLVTVSGTNRNGQTYVQGTSTTRTDTGMNSCEVVYVESFEVLPC